MAVTKEQIWAAADDLQIRGEAPTLIAIRKELGDTGSFSTIAPAMADWRAQRTKTTDAKIPVPDTLLARLRQQAEHAWADALGVADQLVSAERDALRAARKELEAERAEMAALLDDADRQLVMAASRQRELESSNERLAELHLASRTELASAKARLDEREQTLLAERSERQAAQAALGEAREHLVKLEVRHRP